MGASVAHKKKNFRVNSFSRDSVPKKKCSSTLVI
jgi:hypothetical protein